MKNQGVFITFEGGEGTGKSTQTVLLADTLAQKGIKVILTREPGGSEGAELIRALLVSGDTQRWSALSETLLLYAARCDHWQRVIQPALTKGHWVICDRFADSTLAYQGYGHGIDPLFIQSLYTQTIGPRQPDLTFIFDLDPQIGVERALRRHTSENRFENMDKTFHDRLRAGFLEICAAAPQRCVLVEADQSIEAIQQTILEDVQKRFL